jgi:RNA polymerase sigma-70 factor (ECF subfamily)
MNATAIARIEDLATPASIGHGSAGEDETLLARMQAGDESAYEELVRVNGGRMLSTARRMVRSEDDAQDVVQEAFLLAFRSVSSFEGRSQLSTWLHRIVINVSLMKLRRRKRKPEVSIEDETPRFRADGSRIVEAHEVVNLSPADVFERETMRALMRRCMDRLPDSYRVVLMLRDIEDMSTEETADVLGIKAVAVKVRLHRARQALKSLIQKEMMEGEPLHAGAR